MTLLRKEVTCKTIPYAVSFISTSSGTRAPAQLHARTGQS